MLKFIGARCHPNRGKGPFINDVVILKGTLAKTEIIYPKNVGAKVAMDFT